MTVLRAPARRPALAVLLVLVLGLGAGCGDQAGGAAGGTPGGHAGGQSGPATPGGDTSTSPAALCAAIPVDRVGTTLGVQMKAPTEVDAGAGGCMVDGEGGSVSLVASLAGAEGTLEERAALVASAGTARQEVEPREVEVAGARGLLVDGSSAGHVAVVVDLDGRQLVVTLVVITAEVAPDAQVRAVEQVAEAVV